MVFLEAYLIFTGRFLAIFGTFKKKKKFMFAGINHKQGWLISAVTHFYDFTFIR